MSPNKQMLEAKRIVLKIGTSVLLDENNRISPSIAEGFARQVKAIRDLSIVVIVVFPHVLIFSF